MKYVYSVFGFEYRVVLSTRPDKYMGDLEKWNDAEKTLGEALKITNIEYTINDKDGAFYGPKIDVMLRDSLKREHQCGTIQLDFQLPEKFDLSYIDFDRMKQRPVIIHRAILGSIERMFAILIEHFQGKFPLWLSPRQVAIVPIAVKEEFIDYCQKIKQKIASTNNGIDCIEIFDSTDTFNSRIRDAEIQLYNYVLVIGKKEIANNNITFRLINHTRNDSTVDFDAAINTINCSYYSLPGSL